MLLGILPEALRRDIVGARNVSTVPILYTLFVVFQPGGGTLTEACIGTTIHDVLGTIRLWRRWVSQALELKVAILDPLILMQVLGRMSDAVGKLGAQVSYRLASVCQELQVDPIRPLLPAVQEYAEYLQAEAEDLSLMTKPSSTTTPPTSTTVGGSAPPARKAVALNGRSDEKGKPACKLWGTSGGCRCGESCAYSHSWGNVSQEGRCFGCSAEGHMK